MKNTLKVVAIAFALAAVVSTAGAAFNTNLTVGSTGSDVSALQSWLISKGFNIPSIKSGAATPGYFGSQTKAAVVAYQASVGLPSTGFVGPLTRGILNGTSVPSTPVSMGCPVGYTCTAIPGTTPVTTVPGTLVTDGKDGSITLTTSSYVSSTQTLKKGDMNKPILAVKAQATVGTVGITRFDIHFNSRPWLLFSKLTLTDSVGNVIATKMLSDSTSATEITVGTDYMVRFDGVSANVVPGDDRTFVVNADVQAASDKITGQVVTVSTDSSGIRTVNGLGYTDSIGIAISNSVTLASTGSTGDVYTRLGLSTPNTRTENISTTNVTYDQVLGVFDVKLQNQSGTVNQISFVIRNSTGAATSSIFQNVRLYDGATLLGGANSLAAGSATFTNLSIPLTAEMWKSLTLKADVIASATAFSASSTIDAGRIVGVDSNFNTLTLTNASARVANDITFVPNAGITITAITPVKGSVTQPTSGVWLAAYPSISFTINNTGNNPIYISKTSNTALATSTTAGAAASTTVTSTVASGSVSGDTSTSYIINGSRTFTYAFTVDNTAGTTASKKISITQINYGTAGGAGTDNTLNVNYGLENAYVQVP